MLEIDTLPVNILSPPINQQEVTHEEHLTQLVNSETATTPVPENTALFRELISTEGTTKIKQDVQAELEDSVMQHISRLKGRISVLTAELNASEDYKVQQRLNETIKKIENDAVRLFGIQTVDRYDQLIQMKNSNEEVHGPTITGTLAEQAATVFLNPEKLLYTTISQCVRK